MKRKFTILLFGLLLAVGWTNSAQAQSLPAEGFANVSLLQLKDVAKSMPKATHNVATPAQNGVGNVMKAPMRAGEPNAATHNKAYYDALEYTWSDSEGTHTSKATDVADKPEQMYELLRFVYGNPNFPGPTYSAYTSGLVQEDPVYYGAIAGGWDISTAGSGTDAITITTNNSYALLDSIAIKVGDEVLVYYGGYYGDWNSSTGATVFPQGWSASPTAYFFQYNGNYTKFFYMNGGGTITIPKSSLNLNGNNTVQVLVEGLAYSSSTTSTVTINGESFTLSSDDISQFSKTVTFSEAGEYVQGTVIPPYEDGYTALIVAVKNEATPMTETYNSYDNVNSILILNSKQQVIEYFRDRVDFIKLLTDGLRITDAGGNPGTVFNCDGTYNKFFFLGKGQARKKDSQVLTLEQTYGLMGEVGPFKEMFEEFSPTAGDSGSEITDFYSKMMEGNVYNIVHDCASVMQNGHQFSMSGNDGEDFYPMTGLNFFIPDYRLKYWETTEDGYTVDGRTMNPYKSTSGYQFNSRVPSYCANFAQYNTDYAPKVGIYKITLEAVATQVGSSHQEGNQNFVVTLTWVSSLNQMSGTETPQTYTVYYYDPNTGERKYVVAQGITDGKTGLTTVSYPAEQFATSYVIDHIVMGQPSDNEHPTFVAWSNHSSVIIPGWNDFIGLELDHHESDFVISTNSRDNWYRNFLAVINQDKYNGLSLDEVQNGMNTFNLYRQEYKDGGWKNDVKIATITFDQIQNDQIHYTITYVNDNNQSQEIEATKYNRSAMDVPDEGWIRIKGNGDLVIWPNSFYVNFKSIVIKNGNTTLYNWNSSSANVNTGNANLPSAWQTSPGSKMVPYTNTTNDEKVCYLEGGGYIYIPGLLNTYSNLTVQIVAYTDGANVGRIEVNDKSQTITNTSATYTWSANDENNPISPSAAPRHDNNESKPVVNNKTKGSSLSKVNNDKYNTK